MNDPSSYPVRRPARQTVRTDPKFYTLGEEIFNAVSHGVGAGLGVAACVLCILRAVLGGSALAIVSAALYGASLIILYTMSPLYHAVAAPRGKHVLRIFDHCTIFILITGTYTPFTLVAIHRYSAALGWAMSGILWGAAILGIVLNAISLEKAKRLSMVLYLIMGWCVIFAGRAIGATVAPAGIALLFIGGGLYTAGVFFFRSHIRYMHSVWHLFVLAGSICHFFCILRYVL